MCFDPVSAALIVGGSGLSALGGSAEQKASSRFQAANIYADMEQQRQNQAEALRRNEILGEYQTRQKGWIDDNQGNLNTGVAQFSAPSQTTALSDAGANRGNSIAAAINAGGANINDVPMRASTPDVVRDALAKRLGDVFTNANEQGERTAKVGAYGDTWAANQRGVGDTANKVETTNTIAKGNMALLPADQDLAGFQLRKPIFRPAGPSVPGWAGPAKSLGAILGAIGGSGKMAGYNPFGAAPGVGAMSGANADWLQGGIWPA